MKKVYVSFVQHIYTNHTGVYTVHLKEDSLHHRTIKVPDNIPSGELIHFIEKELSKPYEEKFAGDESFKCSFDKLNIIKTIKIKEG